MFASNVRMQLKPNSNAQFTQTLEKEVLPVLRKQEGFQDEVAFIVPGGTEAIAISFWQSKENAESYSRTGYPEVLKALGKAVEGSPTRPSTRSPPKRSWHSFVGGRQRAALFFSLASAARNVHELEQRLLLEEDVQVYVNSAGAQTLLQ